MCGSLTRRRVVTSQTLPVCADQLLTPVAEVSNPTETPVQADSVEHLRKLLNIVIGGSRQYGSIHAFRWPVMAE